MDDYCIEPARGLTYDHVGKVAVYSYGTYGPGSVLEGEERRSFRDEFDSVAAAKLAYPHATVQTSSGFREIELPSTPPSWFDAAIAGERWNEED